MAAVSVQKPPLTDTAQGPAGNLLPELHEQEYMSHVLQLSTDNFESYLESLINRATNLGISLSRPSPVVATPDKSDTLGTDSSATLDTTHIRTAMMGSEDSASTAPTSPTSPSLPSSPALPSSKDATFELTGRFLSRKRPKAPTFIQYENYLIEIDPDFKRSKFTSVSSLEMDYTASIFSASTRRSLFSIRNGLSKIRRKRRSMPPHQELLMYACLNCAILSALNTNFGVVAAAPVEKISLPMSLYSKYHVATATARRAYGLWSTKPQRTKLRCPRDVAHSQSRAQP